jgi:hypothetical protein
LAAERACVWVARVEGWRLVKSWCVAAGGWVCGVVSRMALVGMRDVGCWCAVMARCGRGAVESNVWASDSGDRLAAVCLCRMYAPPAAVGARGYGFGGGMRRCERAAAGVGRRDERVYNREAATNCGMRHARVARVGASMLSCGGGGAVRADGGTGGSGRSMGGVEAAARLERIGAMWLGAERACVWVARAEGWVGGWMDVRSGGC